jgi:hypothetical protein
MGYSGGRYENVDEAMDAVLVELRCVNAAAQRLCVLCHGVRAAGDSVGAVS